jgi:hypothetical protein
VYCIRLAGHVAGMGQYKRYSILVGEAEEKRSLRNSVCRWKDNIKNVV